MLHFSSNPPFHHHSPFNEKLLKCQLVIQVILSCLTVVLEIHSTSFGIDENRGEKHFEALESIFETSDLCFSIRRKRWIL
jgi:hypothetical protein